VPGDRKRYFRLKMRDKYALIDEHHKTLSETRDYLKIVLELKADRNSGTSVFIKDILDMLNFFLDHFMELKSIYEKKK
jgi:hypothetical protein